jgi:hypothetical protein
MMLLSATSRRLISVKGVLWPLTLEGLELMPPLTVLHESAISSVRGLFLLTVGVGASTFVDLSAKGVRSICDQYRSAIPRFGVKGDGWDEGITALSTICLRGV